MDQSFRVHNITMCMGHFLIICFVKHVIGVSQVIHPYWNNISWFTNWGHIVLVWLIRGGCIKEFWLIAFLLMFWAAFFHFIIICIDLYYCSSVPRINSCWDAADYLGSRRPPPKKTKKTNKKPITGLLEALYERWILFSQEPNSLIQSGRSVHCYRYR